MSRDPGDEHVPRDECPLCEYLTETITLAEVERRYCITILRRFHGHRVKSADALGVGLRTLGLWIDKWKEAGVFPEDL